MFNKHMHGWNRLELHEEETRRITELQQQKPDDWPEDKSWNKAVYQLAAEESRAKHDSCFFGECKVEMHIKCPCCGEDVAVELVAGQVTAYKPRKY